MPQRGAEGSGTGLKYMSACDADEGQPLTLVMTDVEGSTELWESLNDVMMQVHILQALSTSSLPIEGSSCTLQQPCLCIFKPAEFYMCAIVHRACHNVAELPDSLCKQQVTGHVLCRRRRCMIKCCEGCCANIMAMKW